MDAVKKNTDSWLASLSYNDIKRTFTEEDNKKILNLKVVSESESALSSLLIIGVIKT